MTREFIDLYTRSQECVEYGEKELGYSKTLNEEINHMENDLKTVEGKVNIAEGGNLKRNRKIVRKPKVDVLMNPVKPKERPFDRSIATVAKENNVSIGITLKKLLEYRGMEKTAYLRSLKYLGKLVEKENCSFIIASGAKEKLDMRAPRELASIGHLLGFNEEKSLDTVSSNAWKIKPL